MGDLSENFSRSEFACSCGCGMDTVDYATVILAEKVREHFDSPVRINSGNRCETFNTSVGGSKGSQHMLSRAFDCTVDGIPPAIVAELLHQLGAGGVGSYATFTHGDTRQGVARWQG